MTKVLLFAFTFLVGTAAGVLGTSLSRTAPLSQEHAVTGSSKAFADRALEIAKQADLDGSRQLFRRAINGMGKDPAEIQLIWQGLQSLPALQSCEKLFDSLVLEFDHTLEGTLLSCESLEDFEQLQRLRTLVQKSLPIKSPPTHTAKTKDPKPPVGIHQPGKDTGDPAVLMRAGLVITHEDLVQADFLTQSALRAQLDKPCSARAVWTHLQRFLEGEKLSTAEEVSRESTYLGTIEATLLACRSPDDFKQVWGVRLDVLAQMAKARARLFPEIRTKLDTALAPVKDKSLISRLESFAKARVQLQPELTALQHSIDPAKGEKEVPDQKAVRDVALELIHGLQKELSKLEVETAKIAAEDQQRKENVGGSPEVSGLCEKRVEEIQTLKEAADKARLYEWLSIFSMGPITEKVEDLNEKMASLHSKFTKLQHLRYNFWALRQIYAAESVENWDVYLANIDIGLLHPTVTSLYSSTYDNRIRKLEDPQARQQTVQSILNKPKISLTAF